MPQMIDTQELTLRMASPADERAVIRLGQLDSGWPPPAPLLLGFAGDRLLAAISLSDGEVIADPFENTAFLVDMLRSRASQLDGTPGRGRLRRRSASRWATA
jgi:hypothetical protein